MYENKTDERLYQLLDQCQNRTEGALSIPPRILIPDLQRAYVWMPDQINRLIDSMIKEWPFGAIVLWNYGTYHSDAPKIPARPFWKNVADQVEQGIPYELPVAPADIRLVLDGQQRIQSLLIALGSDDSSVKLPLSTWREQRGGQRNLTPIEARLYISWPDFCFAQKNQLHEIDWSELLIWGHECQENHLNTNTKWNFRKRKPTDIRFSKIWEFARRWGNLPPASLKNKCNDSLEKLLNGQHETPDEKLDLYRDLCTHLYSVGQKPISCIQIKNLEESGIIDDLTQEPDEIKYNDAIINVFTRLNSGGKVLTREEIIFSKFNRAWEIQGEPGGARRFVKSIAENIVGGIKNTDEDDGMRLVSYLWSASENQGKLLKNHDLISGDFILRMSGWAYENQQIIFNASSKAGEVYRNSTLKNIGRGDSLNSVFALSLAYFGHFCHTQNDHFNTRQASFSELGNRWLSLARLAGIWSSQTDRILGEIAIQFGNLQNKNPNENIFIGFLNILFEKYKEDAIKYVTEISVNDRGSVSQYRYILTLWYVIHGPRATLLQEIEVLNLKGKKDFQTEVDHIYPIFLTQQQDQETWNSLGACMLLGKSGNASKGKKTLRRWHADLLQDQINGGSEFAEKYSLKNIQEILCIEECFLDENYEPMPLKLGIEARTTCIRKDIIDYLNATF